MKRCRPSRLWSLAIVAALHASMVPAGVRGQATDPPRTPGEPAASVTGVVRGQFQGSVRPLAWAVVEAATVAGPRMAVADSIGRFTLDRLPAGEMVLRASAVGHAPMQLRVRVPADGTLSVDLSLTATPLELEGVAVRSDSTRTPRDEIPEADPRAATPIPNPALEVTLLEISPGVGSAGLAEAVGGLSGNDPADPSDVLFMRGSTTELKLVLLDGVPVFTPFHVAGLMRSFEPTTLESASLHVGGASARYDGGLTHILDLRTRTARRDRLHATGSLDLISASLAVETPLGSRAGLVASARTLHDLGEIPLGGERPYGYREGLVSFDAEPAEDHRLRVTGFWNDESVRLDFDPVRGDATWSNRAASASYSAPLGSSARLQITAGASRYRAALPLQPARRPGEEDPPEAMLASASSDRGRVVGEVAWDRDTPVRVGVSFEDQRAEYAATTLSGDAGTTNQGTSTALGAYVEATHTLVDGVTLRAGLRTDVFGGSTARLAPRVKLFWEVGPDALVSVAAGRYHQAGRTPHPELEAPLIEIANGEVRSGPLLPVATADHVVVTLGQRLGGSVALELDGYWKRFTGLRGGQDGASVLNSGVDLRVLRASDTGSIWLGYGLSWFWSPIDLSGNANDFSGRHLLSTGVSGRLVGPVSAEARLAYGAGLPSTSIPFGSRDSFDSAAPDPTQEVTDGPTLSSAPPLASPLDDSFLRLDLEIHAMFEARWGGRPWRIRPYVRLLNALDRRDALFYAYQPWRPDSVTPLAERPILPVLGIAFSF